MSDTIVVDTQKLREYGLRVNTVNSGIKDIDKRMDSLYLKVGFNGLLDLLQADIMTVYGVRLSVCGKYLIETSEEFEKLDNKLCDEKVDTFDKPAVAGVSESLYDFGNAVKAKATEVISNIDFEKARYVGEYVATICLTGVEMVTSTALLFSGAGSAVGVLGLIDSCNKIANTFHDMVYIHTGEYDKIGKKNYLKEILIDSSIKLTNDEKLGETVYFMMDAVDFLDDVDGMLESFGKVDLALGGSSRNTFAWGRTEFDDIMENSFDVTDYTKTDVIIRKLLNVDPNSTGNFIYEAAKNVKKVWDNAPDIAHSYVDIIVGGEQNG
ncbi:MAG: hypothetical protein IKI97_11490 [Clostridia bacterium]|nr:hypothetical protein [Clostridia bacterium]